jgi:hypothetical protein
MKVTGQQARAEMRKYGNAHPFIER